MVSHGANSLYDFAIIGGGIIGLSTGMVLTQRYPNASVLVLEKESQLACHQTGNNSGVIHSEIYYKPGSFKPRFCRQGARSMVKYCREHGIKHDVCGKVIVATEEKELPLLGDIYQRGVKNGLEVAKINADEIKEIGPHVNCLAGIRVPPAGIVDFRQVSLRYAELIEDRGGEIQLNTMVKGIASVRSHPVLETNNQTFEPRFLIRKRDQGDDALPEQGSLYS